MAAAKRAQMIRVAELYYLQNMTQQEIAHAIGLSRPTVSRLLEEARNQDIVEIRLNIAEEVDVKLSNCLRQSLGIKEAIVVNTREADEELSLQKTARVAAEYVTGIVKDHMTVGISWGRAMKAVANAMSAYPVEDIKVVQTVGGVGTAESEFDGAEVTYILASKLNGVHQSIFGPAVLPDVRMREELSKMPAICQVLKTAAKADAYIMGIGSLNESFNSLQRAGYLDEQEKAGLIARGGVAHILAQIVKADGSEMEEFNCRCLSIPLECLKGNALSVGITVSAAKADAVLAVTKGGYLDVLIVDHACAEAILEKKSNFFEKSC